MFGTVPTTGELPDHENPSLRHDAEKYHRMSLTGIRQSIGDDPAKYAVAALGISIECREIAVDVLMKLLSSKPDIEERNICSPPKTAGERRSSELSEAALREYVSRLAQSWGVTNG